MFAFVYCRRLLTLVSNWPAIYLALLILRVVLSSVTLLPTHVYSRFVVLTFIPIVLLCNIEIEPSSSLLSDVRILIYLLLFFLSSCCLPFFFYLLHSITVICNVVLMKYKKKVIHFKLWITLQRVSDCLVKKKKGNIQLVSMIKFTTYFITNYPIEQYC